MLAATSVLLLTSVSKSVTSLAVCVCPGWLAESARSRLALVDASSFVSSMLPAINEAVRSCPVSVKFTSAESVTVTGSCPLPPVDASHAALPAPSDVRTYPSTLASASMSLAVCVCAVGVRASLELSSVASPTIALSSASVSMSADCSAESASVPCADVA